MKLLKFGTIGMLLIAMLLSVNADVFAQRGVRNGNGKCYRQFNNMEQGSFCNNIPDLTDDQQTKIDALRTTHRKEMRNNSNQLAEKNARLQTLRSADHVDMNEINETINEISIIQTSLQKNREQHFQDVRNLLTDDQRVNFDNFNRGKGRGQGYGYGKGKGRCGRNL